MPAPIAVNPNHWANRSCLAWWSSLPGISGGSTLADLLGRYPVTLVREAGTDARVNQCWSPSNGTNSGVLGGIGYRPGGLAGSYVGPFTWASTTYAGTTSLDLNQAQAAGTVSLWHCPALAYTAVTGNDFWVYQGNAGATGNFFGIYTYAGSLNLALYNGSYYQAGTSLTSSVWSPNQWAHWTFTWAVGDFPRIYYNGQLWNTGTQSQVSFALSTGYLCTLGALPAWSRVSTSAFDDINVWSRQLKAAEVSSIYRESLSAWPTRHEVVNPRRIFLPPFDVVGLYTETGVRPAAGGIAQGGAATVDTSRRPATGGIAQGGAAAPFVTPYVATPARPSAIPSSTHWANRGAQAWWLSVPGATGGGTFLDLFGRYNATATAVSGSDARKFAYWSPSPGNSDASASVPNRSGAYENRYFGPFQFGAAPTKWRATTTADLYLLAPNAGTISCWIRPTQPTAGTISFWLTQRRVDTYPGWFMGIYQGTLEAGFLLSGGNVVAGYTAGSEWDVTKWMHIATTYAVNDVVKLYVNGVLKATSSTSLPSSISAISSGSDFLLMGCGHDIGPWSYFFQGTIDDVCVWNWRMSDLQILSSYVQSQSGWPGRLDQYNPSIAPGPPYDLSLEIPGPSQWTYTGTGGLAYGGARTSFFAFHPAAAGGLAQGGSQSPTLAYTLGTAGGMRHGADINSPLAWDTFTGTFNTPLQNHVSDDGQSWLRHPSYSTGNLAIYTSNNLYQPSANTSVFLHSMLHPSADYVVSLDASYGGGLSSSYGLLARWDSSANTGYKARWDAVSSTLTATITITRVVNGTEISLGTSGSFSVASTQRLAFTVAGSSLSAYVNGALKLGPIADTSISAIGSAGIYCASANTTFDNFTSTGGGVRSKYVLGGTGGLAQGGHAYLGGVVYVMPCSGGVRQGAESPRAGRFAPGLAGGMRQGAESPRAGKFAVTPSGGVTHGGSSVFGVSFLATGGQQLGGSTSPTLGYMLHVGGGERFGGRASVTSAWIIRPFGGMAQAGSSDQVHGWLMLATGGMRQGGSTTWQALVYQVYANTGTGDPINYGAPLASLHTLTYTTAALTGPSSWSFGVRAYDPTHGLEEKNVDAAVTVLISSAGADVSNIPAAPIAITGHAGPGGTAVLSWHYQRPAVPAQTPTQFRVYQGTTSVNYSAPALVVPYNGLSVMTATVSGLANGTSYLFSIRAANSLGEEANTTTISIVAERTGPASVMNFTVSATS